jgi:hypothetical protein
MSRQPCVVLVVSIREPGRHRRRLRSVKIFELQPGHIAMATPITVAIGHKVNCTLAFLDQNGNPMLTPVTPDSPPAWSDSTPATGTLTAAPDGLSASEAAIAAGSDTISVTVIVGGVSFAATLGVTVSPAPQVMTSVAIEATVV